MTDIKIDGYCPMGCGPTLFLANSGSVMCSRLECPRPTAVSELLADSETEHVVQFTEATFTVRHPLHERLDDALMDCHLHGYIASLDGPPTEPGVYRALNFDGGQDWVFDWIDGRSGR